MRNTRSGIATIMKFRLCINAAKVGFANRYDDFFRSIQELGVTIDENNRLDIPSQEILEQVSNCIQKSGIPDIRLEKDNVPKSVSR